VFDAFPVQVKLFEAVRSGQYRIIGFGGAIRGSKTWGTLAMLVTLCRVFPRSRWAIVRKDLPTLRRNVVPSFAKLRTDYPAIGAFVGDLNQSDWTYTCTNGSQILLFPESLDTDPELGRWKGLEVNGFDLEECDELAEKSFHKAIERAGSWIMPDGTPQPPPLVLCTFNPCANWPKHVFYDPWANGTIAAPYAFIPALSTDNPAIPAQTREAWKAMPEQEYKRFVEGDWTVLSGRYYDNVDPRVHLIPRSALPKQLPSWWGYWGAFDWGYAHWAVFGAFAQDSDGTDYLLDSLWMRRQQDTEYAATIRATMPAPCLDVVYAGHDCWARATARGASGVTTTDVFAEQGIYLRQADIDLVNGGRALRRRLDAKRDPETGKVTKAPKLYVIDTPGNRRVLSQLAEIMPDENNVEKPAKVNADSEGRGGDDGADMLRYGIASRNYADEAPVRQPGVSDLQEVAWANARGENLDDGGYAGGVTMDYDPVDYG
jgi:hypothetical protein